MFFDIPLNFAINDLLNQESYNYGVYTKDCLVNLSLLWTEYEKKGLFFHMLLFQ